eukprot:TRINITY_DN18006_c0_g1_i1.p1 TRINITY_DN18006_c0_g1~~TRINITY_DN18006_c0_g1_i1.p1  ORF type:complete len:129 (+),score=29.78 TRINITY_DN18006_c0_g1_i1:57-389(+)
MPPTPAPTLPTVPGSALDFLPSAPPRDNYVFAILFTLILAGCLLMALVWTAKAKLAQDGSLWNEGSVFAKAENDFTGFGDGVKEAAANKAVDEAKKDPKKTAEMARRFTD